MGSMSTRRTLIHCSLALLWTTAACREVGVAPSGGGDAVSTRLVITPGQVRLVAVGDTTRLRAALYDADGNRLAGAVAWTSADPAVFTIDQSGLATGKQPQSVGRAIGSASGRTDTAYVVIGSPNASPCLGYAAPVALAVGQVAVVSMSDGACITSAGGGDEYIIMPWYGTSDTSSTMPLGVTGNGLAAPSPNPMRAPLVSRVTPPQPLVRSYHARDRSTRGDAACVSSARRTRTPRACSKPLLEPGVSERR